MKPIIKIKCWTFPTRIIYTFETDVLDIYPALRSLNDVYGVAPCNITLVKDSGV